MRVRPLLEVAARSEGLNGRRDGKGRGDETYETKSNIRSPYFAPSHYSYVGAGRSGINRKSAGCSGFQAIAAVSVTPSGVVLAGAAGRDTDALGSRKRK